MLLVMDLMVARDVYDAEGRRIVTVFAENMYRVDLKSTCNYADVDLYIVPYLVKQGIKVIWVEKPDTDRLNNSKKMQAFMKRWDIIKRIDMRLFLLLKHIKFHTLYLRKESQSAIFSNAKGIGEVYCNGKHINFDNGFRRTPGNSDKNENSIWLFGACNVRGVGVVDLDDNHTMSAALQRKVAGRYNVINRGSVRSCLNYVMRMTRYKQGDIAVFFSSDYVPTYKHEEVCYLDSTEVLNKISHLRRHITDVLYHCDEVVIEETAGAIYERVNELETSALHSSANKEVFFGSAVKREPSRQMYENNQFIVWLDSLLQYRREGNNGALVLNANPFTYGHRHLVEYATGQVEHLYVMVVEEDKSFFSFEERFQLVQEGTADLNNVTVFPSSQYVISKSSLPGYFEKDTMKGDFLLDASQDILSFVQAARILNVGIRFCGEEPNDRFTEQYNMNMEKMLPEYGIQFRMIPRKEQNGNVISASRVRDFMKEGNLEAIRELVPETTYQYIKKRMENTEIGSNEKIKEGNK